MSEVTTVDAKLLTTPCWWVDRHDPWEITHYPSREEAEQQHVDDVRADEGFPLTAAGVFERTHAELVQEKACCWEFDCPACGSCCHQQERSGECWICNVRIEVRGA